MRTRGTAVLPVLVLLIAAVGAGGYNYWRNLQIENAQPSPYRGYSDTDLAALHEAHGQERGTLEARYQAPTISGEVRGGGFIDQQIEEFDRVHREGRASRRLGGEIASHEGVMAIIEQEQALRSRDASAMAMHLRLSGF